MSQNNHNIFMTNRRNAIMLMTGLSALFFMGLTLQVVFGNDVIRIYVSVMLIAVTFLFNVTLGTPGLILATSWNLLQLVIYIYEYNRYDERVPLYLTAMAIISMIISFLFRLFISRVNGIIGGLYNKISREKTRRLPREESNLISESAVMSGGLIVRHNQMEVREDVSEVIEMSRSAGLDPLTTLPNRDRLTGHIGYLIDQNISNSRAASDTIMPVYIIYLSIDGTDEIRKKEGHKRLDLFVQSMAHRIREIADSADMVGHVSATEFVIATGRGISEDGLLFYIDSLCKAAASSFRDKDGSPVVTVSAGYSGFPSDGRFPGELISKAEAAMSEAQRAGGGCIRGSASSSGKVGGNIISGMTADEIADMLDKAFDNDGFRMVYQPRFADDNKLIGFEAFIRLSNIGTPELLDAAVLTGNLCRIGEFSFTRAMSRLSELNRLDPDLTMTINLSAEQLNDDMIASDIRKAVEGSGCNPANLVFDIPEESLIGSSEIIKPLLDEFTSMGIRIALDNFGRGYSSLNNIPLLPISSMNLDGNFTAELDDNSSSGILTSTIIELLDEIDIPVCATGVESEHQYKTLLEYGCTYFQGKFLCEPLENDSLEDYILSRVSSEPDAGNEDTRFELDI